MQFSSKCRQKRIGLVCSTYYIWHPDSNLTQEILCLYKLDFNQTKKLFKKNKNHMQNVKPFSETEHLIAKSDTIPSYLISEDFKRIYQLKESKGIQYGNSPHD